MIVGTNNSVGSEIRMLTTNSNSVEEQNLNHLFHQAVINILEEGGPNSATNNNEHNILRISTGIFSYLTSSEGMKFIALRTGTLALLYLAPGIWTHYVAHTVVIKGGLLKELLALINDSTLLWKGYLGLNALGATGSSLALAGTGAGLYYSLCIGPATTHYAAWRIARQQVFAENTLVEQDNQDDPIINQHICPITLYPIRHPVKDPHGHVFEGAAILAWLETNRSCPLNRQPLSPRELKADIELDKKIEQRLKELKK